MEKKQNITHYRERLNKTLASPDLTDEESLETLVKSQLLRSSEDEAEGCNQKVIEKRTAEVSRLLDMLRSTSLNDKESKASTRSQAEWKLKQDNEEFRVMYRKGLEGTPFHTLLVEGYVDGPVDLCLCLSWETSLYSKWWPQFSVPTFKILSCKCLQKVRIGEQISLVRMKVSWPLSTREAVVHYFLFEYFQDDLIVVLLNTISDSESIDKATHGFTNEAIPEAKDVVRIDVVGGFALQKVTSERSYFRTIANVDVKLDFVPPSLINFISRQLIGNGFRLYQKAVASVFKCDTDFIKALRDQLYAKIHEALYSTDVPKGAVEEKELKTDEYVLPEEHLIERKQNDLMHTNQEVHSNYHVSEYELKNGRVTDRKAFGEIEEEEKGAVEGKELKTDECVLPEEHLIEGKQDDLMHANQEVHSNYHVSEYELKNGRVTDRKAFGEIEEEERGAVEGKELKTDECVLPEEHLIEGKQDDLMHTNQEVHSNYHVSEYELKNGRVMDRKAFGEIEEEESEESRDFEEDSQDADHISSKELGQRCNVSGKRNISISPEVEQALGTLEKVISVAREYGFNAQTGFSSDFTCKGPPNMESHLALDSNPSTDERICLSGEVTEVSLEVWRKENVDRALQEPPRNSSSNLSFRNAGSNSFSREVNHKKIAPASPGQYLSVANSQVALYSSANGTSEVLTLEQSTYETKQASMNGNGTHGIHGRSQNGEGKSSKQKNHLFCFSIRRWLC